MRNVKINDVKFDKMEKRGNKKWGWLIAVVLLLATAAACVWYVNDYYHAEEYEYEHWYVSGHSLGGAMAANFAAEHGEKLEGLVLFAAYATKELPDNLCTVSVYGSEDNVLNMEKVESGRVYMPADYTEYCIQGGNHAWFAYYGEQDGDGTATVTREEQQRLTVDAIVNKLIK